MAILVGKSVTISQGILGYNITGRFIASYAGRYSLYAIGYADVNASYGFHGALSGYSFSAAGGAQGRMTLPLPTLVASGKATSLGRVSATLPKLAFSGHGVATQLGQVRATLAGDYVFVGKGGAIVRGKLSRPTFTGHGFGGALSSFRGTAPRPTLSAHGTQGTVGSLVAVLPTLESRSSIIRVYFPRFTLYAVGSSGAAVTYEAYSVSLLKDDKGEQACVTHYTNYPFDRIVRFGAKYYGIATDGLFELTGDTFNSVPIVAVIRTGETDFKVREVKRPISMYVAGRVGGDFSVAVTPAEVKDYTYAYRPVIKTGARNYRVLFGKGIRARYLSYVFSNTQGDDFDIDELTPEVAVLRRTA